eukprot:2950827-Ditylum_brightwellii.AAC.1
MWPMDMTRLMICIRITPKHSSRLNWLHRQISPPLKIYGITMKNEKRTQSNPSGVNGTNGRSFL